MAEQFHTATELVEEFTGDPAGDTVNNAFVTHCVHAGIDAADVICCARLGRYARGEDHKAAAELLASVDKSLGLALKTPAGYLPRDIPQAPVSSAKRRADRLVTTAREIHSE